MDKDEREDENRDSPTLSETQGSRHKILLDQLRSFLHTHGYPTEEEGEKSLHSTTDLSEKEEEEEGNPESSEAVPNWSPSFHSYDDFHLKILQSLGTFIIILSTDGVIIYATENVSPLLGYTIDEIVGKKLLSLLPEEEKRDVFQKLCLKLPVSNSVGRRVEFCCHLKRGDLQDDDKIIYEYSKFFLCLKDVTDEPLEFLTRFFPSPKYVESSTTELPLEDRFYMVGTVCILKTQTLWDHLTGKDTGQDSQTVEPSDEENSSTKGQMEPLGSASTGSASCDVDTEQYESQESARTSGDISLTSPETTRSSATTSSQNLEYEPAVEEGYTTVEVEQVQRMEQMEEEPFRISSPIEAYINKREKELIMRFKRKLDEKTQMLQADIRKQRKEMKLMKEQLNTLQDSKFQMQPTMPHHIGSYESQALEPAPKKQRTEQMKKSFSDTSETKSFHALCPPRSIRFSELFKEPGPFGPSTQIQATDAPLQLAAEKQDKNIESQEEESQSFIPEDQQKRDVSPLTYSTDSDVLPASSSPSPVSSDSDVSSLETTQDYIQLWPKTSDPHSRVKYEVKSWPCTDQDQGNGSEQELSPEEETEETSGLRASQDTADDPSEKVSTYLSSDQSESDE